jgi:hypothetical protein
MRKRILKICKWFKLKSVVLMVLVSGGLGSLSLMSGCASAHVTAGTSYDPDGEGPCPPITINTDADVYFDEDGNPTGSEPPVNP